MKKLVALSLAGLLACTPVTVFADDADLEARVTALEEKVAALEAQLSGSAAGSAASDDAIEYDGCTLEYKDYTIDTDYEGDDAIILYFDFFNGSEDTTSFYSSFDVSMFQNGKEAAITDFPDDPASHDRITDLQPDAGPIQIATCFKLTDHSDVIVSMKPLFDFDYEPVEFTLSLE